MESGSNGRTIPFFLLLLTPPMASELALLIPTPPSVGN